MFPYHSIYLDDGKIWWVATWMTQKRGLAFEVRQRREEYIKSEKIEQNVG